ncbi:hypothetical protein AVEN_117120-1 [Araneus ventricosus]|uniref:Uncharacterized protein n=1 Tax=Araneus ventricosus TaxID=182803 RepID=A0A4Y2K7J5_ARAVE|nr:hypothetical protein AVEN_117120-1 [Araneus ventricosus]
MMTIGSSVDYVRSGMRNVPVTKAVEHLYATTAKFSGCVVLASRPGGEDRKDGVSYENLAETYPSNMIHPIESKEDKRSARADSMLIRLTQEKNDTSSREIAKDLKLNVSALAVSLIIKNSGLISSIQRKRP